jgi:hypothetical protein
MCNDNFEHHSASPGPLHKTLTFFPATHLQISHSLTLIKWRLCALVQRKPRKREKNNSRRQTPSSKKICHVISQVRVSEQPPITCGNAQPLLWEYLKSVHPNNIQDSEYRRRAPSFVLLPVWCLRRVSLSLKIVACLPWIWVTLEPAAFHELHTRLPGNSHNMNARTKSVFVEQHNSAHTQADLHLSATNWIRNASRRRPTLTQSSVI